MLIAAFLVAAASAAATPPPCAPAVGDAPAPRTLRLRARPWADIFVDGALVARGALSATAALAPGRHVARFTNPAARDVEIAFDVPASGDVAAVVAELAPRPALLVVRASEPGAFVCVDGEDAVTAKPADDTVAAPLLVPLGDRWSRTVDVVVYKAGFAPITVPVALLAGRTRVVDVALRTPPASAAASDAARAATQPASAAASDAARAARSEEIGAAGGAAPAPPVVPAIARGGGGAVDVAAAFLPFGFAQAANGEPEKAALVGALQGVTLASTASLFATSFVVDGRAARQILLPLETASAIGFGVAYGFGVGDALVARAGDAQAALPAAPAAPR